MFLALYETLTIFLLLLAGLSGIVALRSLRDPETSYRFRNLFRRDLPLYRNPDIGTFLMYFALISSTFGSFLAAYLRAVWVMDLGLGTDTNDWETWWLTSHCIEGITFTCLHVIVYFRQKRVYSGK